MSWFEAFCTVGIGTVLDMMSTPMTKRLATRRQGSPRGWVLPEGEHNPHIPPYLNFCFLGQTSGDSSSDDGNIADLISEIWAREVDLK